MYEKYDLFIGKRITFLRKKRKLTQKRLASRVGISFQQLQKYEYGVNRLSLVRLFQLSKALEVSLFSFFEDFVNEFGDNVSDYIGTAPGPMLTADQRKLVECFEQIPNPETRSALFDMISSLSGSSTTK